MPRVFYLHWHEEELEDRLNELESKGFDAYGHWDTETHIRIADDLPDAAVVSLDRLPSHGRAFAEWLWEAKKRQHIPLIFAGGKPDKVEATRIKFPNAIFCRPEQVGAAVLKALENTAVAD